MRATTGSDQTCRCNRFLPWWFLAPEENMHVTRESAARPMSGWVNYRIQLQLGFAVKLKVGKEAADIVRRSSFMCQGCTWGTCQ